MTWPTSPPPMPAPGWYADPEQAWTWRYWDGGQWTAHRAPMHGPPHRDPYSFSAWFEDSTRVVKATIRRVAVLVLAVYLVIYAAFAAVFAVAYTSAEGRELRDLLDIDGLFEPGGTITVELTDLENDRVLDLLRELGRTWLPILVVVSVLALLVMVWTVTLAALVAWSEVDDIDAGPSIIEAPSVYARSVRRTPATLLSAFVIGLATIVTAAGPLIPLFIAIGTEAASGVVAITAVFGVTAAIVLTCWVIGRLCIVPVLAARGGHGLGISRSWELTRGHFWGSVGRVIVASLIASVASVPFSFVGGFGSTLGVSAWFVTMVIAQAVSGAASAVVTVPAQVVLADHLDQQHRLSGTATQVVG